MTENIDNAAVSPEEPEMSPSPAITESDIEEQLKKMGRVLARQPKTRVRIPRLGTKDKPNPLDAIPVPVTVNGYTFLIRRGENVEVPQVIGDILEDSGYLW